MESERREGHTRLSDKETDAGESMIPSDVDENGISENEASKRARASRKLLVVAVLLVIAAVLLAAVAITVGLTLTGDVRRTIGEKDKETGPSSTLSPSSHIPTLISSTIPHTDKHSSPQNISPTKAESTLPTHSTSISSVSQTISPSSLIHTQSKSDPSTSLPTSSVFSTYVTVPSTELPPLTSSLIVSTTVYPTSSITTTPAIPECHDDEFRCASGQCVDKSLVCNKAIDCLDQSDEKFCRDCARSRGFQCDSGLCIWDIRRRCNGVFDCTDLSDEQNCPRRSNYFLCDNDVQIPARYRCNGVDDCYDNSDEVNCRCKNGRTACADGRCIMREWVCDGYPDCSNGTDEVNCNTCSETEFTCRDYTCVGVVQVCDGEFQCRTGEDEGQCVHLTSIGASSSVSALTVQIGVVRYSVCSDRWSDTHSHYLCRHLNKGYQFTEFLDIQSRPPPVFLSLQPGAVFSRDHPFNSFFQKRSSCPSNKTVALSCAPQECGTRKGSVMIPYVAGGNVVPEGRWPWVVSLTYLGQARCAGALIDPQWVITAGHCVVRPGQFNHTSTPGAIEVTAGSVARLTNNSSSVQRVRAAKILHHPGLAEVVSGVLDWDAALVKLERPLAYSEYVQPICLPYSGQGVPVSSSCYLAGWGLVSSQQNLFPLRLREARMLVWERERCETNTVRQETRVNTNSTLCAGYLRGLPTGCQGDSGGPLMCRESPGGPWFLAGIMSGGSQQCGNSFSGQANRFARVEGLLPWLQEIVYGI